MAKIKKSLVQESNYKVLQDTFLWIFSGIILLSPFFRGLFFSTDQQVFGIAISVIMFCVILFIKENDFFNSITTWFIVAFSLVYIITTLNSVNTGLAINEAIIATILIFTYTMSFKLIDNDKRINVFLYSLILAGVCVSIIGMLAASGLINITDGFLYKRISSTFEYPNTLASYLGAICIISTYCWYCCASRQKSKEYGLAISISTYLMVLAMVGTKSNGGLFVFLISWLLFVFLINSNDRLGVLYYSFITMMPAIITGLLFVNLAANKPAVAWAVVILGAAATCAGQFTIGTVLSKLQALDKQKIMVLYISLAFLVIAGGLAIFNLTSVGKDVVANIRVGDAVERTYFYNDAILMVKSRPIFGWGGGGWQEAYRAFQSYFYVARVAHNFYLQVAVETGIVGLLIVLGIWASLLITTVKAYLKVKKLEDNHKIFLLSALFTSILLICIHAAMDFDLSFVALSLTLFSLIGLLNRYCINLLGKEALHVKLPIVTKFIYCLFSVLLFFVCVNLISANNDNQAAIQEFKSNNLVAAVSYLKNVISENPYNVDSHNLLGQIYYSQGDYKSAFVQYSQSVRDGSYSPENYIYLASTEEKLGDYNSSINHLDRAIRMAPFSITFYELAAGTKTNIAADLLSQGDKTQAQKVLKSILAMPQDIEKEKNKLTTEEKKLWKDGPMLSVTPNLRVSMGAAEYLLGQDQNVESNLKSGLTDKQSANTANLWLAVLYNHEGKTTDAEAIINKLSLTNSNIRSEYDKLKAIKLN